MKEKDLMEFDPGDFARGWLSVACASGTDKDRPMLHRTVLIEQFPDGVQLVATDSYMLFRSWVPSLAGAHEVQPAFDEAPMATAVARDIDLRCAGMMKYVLKLVRAAEDPDSTAPMPKPIRLALRDPLRRSELDEPREGADRQFEGMEAKYVSVSIPDLELVQMEVFDGSYPTWRAVDAGFRQGTTDRIALSEHVLTRIAKLMKLWPDLPLHWRFGGHDRGALVEIAGSEPWVGGIAMPVRWDVVANEPYPEPADPEDDDLGPMDGEEGFDFDDDVEVAEAIADELERRINVEGELGPDVTVEVHRGSTGPGGDAA